MAPNLEKHPTKPGNYIAYDADGFAWRCTRTKFGGWAWFATPSHAGAASDPRATLYADKLGDLAARVGKSSR